MSSAVFVTDHAVARSTLLRWIRACRQRRQGGGVERMLMPRVPSCGTQRASRLRDGSAHTVGMSDNARTLPVFPLGRPLLPGEPVPLRVFEPRYLEMMATVLDGDREFGVVLISRGSEVGGGDERVGIGTVASIVESMALGEEQLAVVGIGTDRFRVERWLPDDPFPVATVGLLPDGEGRVDPERVEALRQQTVRLYALASELGADTSGQDLTLPEDDDLALWRLCSLVPLGELDRQRLLEAADGAARAALLGELVGEVTEELTLRLAAG
jgi:uncharacterized protein